MSRATPCLALVVCTRDRPLQLRRCLDSLARQPLALIRDIVLIDQSSTPEPERVVASHALAARIRYVRQPGTGVSRARNLAVTMLHEAEIILFVDDDCTAEPGWLAAMVAPTRGAVRRSGVRKRQTDRARPP